MLNAKKDHHSQQRQGGKMLRLALWSVFLGAWSVILGILSLWPLLRDLNWDQVTLFSIATWQVIKGHPAAISLTTLLLISFLPSSRAGLSTLKAFIHRKWMAFLCLQRDQCRAQKDFPSYRDSFQHNTFYFNLDPKKLAETTGIALWRVRLFCLFPCLIPTRKCLAQITKALSLPPEFFNKEDKSYSSDCVESRLRRFTDLGMEVFTHLPIEEMTSRRRRELLRKIEEQLQHEFEDAGRTLR